MNSASVAGVFPEAVHLRVSPHAPVWHVPAPRLSKLHPVRPHIRPLHAIGAVKTADCPCFSGKPPPSKYSPGKIAGQMVSLQLFIMVKTLADSEGFGPV